jgi:hypothetical protein
MESLISFEVLTVLLPVHNRGSLTANFIVHLIKVIPHRIHLKFVIFDDGCTDDTLLNIKKTLPSFHLVCLDGSAFWGGSINAIVNYIKSSPSREDSLYLLANDDIRFPSSSALMAGLHAVERGALICAKGLLVDNLNDANLEKPNANLTPLSQGTHYNSKKGSFEQATSSKPVNVSETYAMLATKDVWLSGSTVPSTIPHYLSDYWFTYNLVLKGFRIVHPDNFICLVSTHTTRNKPGNIQCNWFKDKARYLQTSLNKTSTSYFPAWIEFLSKKPICLSVRIKILKLKINNYVAIFLYGR